MKDNSIYTAKIIFDYLNSYVPTYLTRSPCTMKSYKESISLFLTFLENEKNITSSTLNPNCFSKENLDDWLLWLKDTRRASINTQANRLAAMRSFLKYLSSKDIKWIYLYENSRAVTLPKIPKRKIQGLSKKAVKTLLETPDPSTKTGRRDLTIMIMLYSTAARIDELLSLKIGCINISCEKPYVVINGKGNKIRTIYLLPKAIAHLKKYLEEFHTKHDENAYLFYSRNTGQYGKLTQPAIDKMLKKYALIASKSCPDVPIALHAHQFRHARASHWLEEGMNIVEISFLLGHANIQTTMVYLDVTTEQERAALATLEDENDKKITPKWKKNAKSLKDFCGITSYT